MIVILFLALAVTNIIIEGLRGQVKQEGMATAADEEDAATEEAPTTTTKKESMETLVVDDKEDSSKNLKKRMSSEAQAKKDIKNLLDLQLKLMTGVNSLQPVLKEVEGVISDLRNKSFQ
jgi:hypothetical protein